MVYPDISANDLSQAIHSKQVSCREVMQTTLLQIAQHNPQSNALVSLAEEDVLLRQADERDAQLARGESMGWMHGMPQAVKDLFNVAGFRTSMGSTLTPSTPAISDDLIAGRMKAAGCIVIGKSNTPESGLGSHTFNEVFGATRNAWDPHKTAGGSSGGAAVAVAQRMLPVADGSDVMGSLRNPAGWNHIFGMRPSQGRVPAYPTKDVWIAQMGIEGPMARSVRDLSMLLSIQAGYHPGAPLSIAQSGEAFAAPLDSDIAGQRIGWLADLNGYLPMEAGVLDTCAQALTSFESMGCHVEPTELGMDPAEAWDTWLVWRQAFVGPRIALFMTRPENHAQVKPEARWEYEQSMQLSGPQLLAASASRTRFYQQMRVLFERFDVLAIPSAQVWPFDVNIRWPSAINGRSMDTYHRWMEVVIYATLAGLPCISVPAGFSQDGLPMGLQLIGKPQGDFALLQLAHAYEQANLDMIRQRPPGV